MWMQLCNYLDVINKYVEVNEHKFIHKSDTLKPHGLNAVDPFGIPLLNL